MAKKKKGQRADGLIEIARKMPDGKTRHFYGTAEPSVRTSLATPIA